MFVSPAGGRNGMARNAHITLPARGVQRRAEALAATPRFRC